MNARNLVASLALLVLLLGTSCGEDAPDAANATTSSTATTAPTGTDAPKSDECGDSGEAVEVEIPAFEFSPATVSIEACQSVVWKNAHTQAHTSTGTGDQRWNTENIAPGDRSEPVTFTDAGTYTYICALHPFMEGTVEVAS